MNLSTAPRLRHAVLVLLVLSMIGLSACSTAPSASSRQVVVELPGDPLLAQEWYERGLDAVRLDDLEEAEVCFREAIDADESHGPAHNNLGKIYYQSDRLQDAALSFQLAVDNMPFRPEPANNLGLVLETGNRFDAAAQQYEAALALDADNLEYVANLARLRVKRGDDDASLRRQLWQIADNDTREPWVTWAQAQLERLD